MTGRISPARDEGRQRGQDGLGYTGGHSRWKEERHAPFSPTELPGDSGETPEPPAAKVRSIASFFVKK